MLAQPLPPKHMASHHHSNYNVHDRHEDEEIWRQQISLSRPFAKSVGTTGANLSYAQHEMLRSRKTPQGRQQEHLTFSNIDDHLQLPASKHVLLSRSPPSHGKRLQNYSPSEIQNTFNGSNVRSYNAKHSADPVRSLHGSLHGSISGTFDPTSALRDPLRDNRQVYYNAWSQVPTVMPAYMHSYGPTAPAGQQYYGPYWPDGTFSPYRPVPMRDDRSFHWRQSLDLNEQVTGSSLTNSQHVHLQQDSTQVRSHQQTSEYGQGHQSLHSLPPRDAHPQYPSFHDRVSNVLDPFYTRETSPPRAYQGLPIPQSVRKPYEDQQSTAIRSNSASDLLARHDRAFAWAYKVYIELLASIQRDSKLERNKSGQTSQYKTVSKPAIFPRPPQRSNSYFTTSAASKESASRSGRRSDTTPFDQADTSDSLSRPQTAIRRSTDPMNCFHQQYSAAQTYNHAPIRLNPPFTIAGSASSAYSSIDQSIDNAYSALTQIETCCHETQTPWLDGMLLAGCLAYGIGNYDKALRWYRKVLKTDARNVEAISNLGATYLALGQKEEAVHNWTAAIKLRPSYFEAVEHLVGLYVNTHRPKDAVSIIEFVESCLKLPAAPSTDTFTEEDSDSQSRASSTTISEGPFYDYELDRRFSSASAKSDQLHGFGASGYAIPAADNGRLLALIHAKGNMLYSLGDNKAAAQAFEEAILLATGGRDRGIKGLIENILHACISTVDPYAAQRLSDSKEPILLAPDRAQIIAHRMFPPNGHLPGFEFVPSNIALKAAVSTASNSLLSLAKIYQDRLCSQVTSKASCNPGTREILALYYLSLSLQPSPSTANNVGILLATVQTSTVVQVVPQHLNNRVYNYTGVMPGSGVALALAYYNYGLNLDGKHAHLYTNLGSLLKDLGELQAAIRMYEIAVSCDDKFDIALANLANAVKDQGRIADAIRYYRRAVEANPDFAEAVCGLATALNSVCDWYGRGGVYVENQTRDRIHVDDHGMMYEGRKGSGWMNKVVEIVDRQLREGENWGSGFLKPDVIESLCRQLTLIRSNLPKEKQVLAAQAIRQSLQAWAGHRWEGSRVVRLLERATKQISWQWYQDKYKNGKEYSVRRYARPTLPAALSIPSAPTVLPFHTFTTPLSAKQVRQISQRNALRISVSTMRSSWLPRTVYPPPPPPHPCLNVGYVSSDFNNHPLAHLMQSIFGLHNPESVRAHCYATTASDGSIHRQQIEKEAPVFVDVSSWKVERLINRILDDKIHVLVNLNGYTRGAKNELFAARPAPVHMSFMGFAGTLGAEWCDYVYADEISIPQQTLAPFRYNVDIEDKLNPQSQSEDLDDWVYAENIIFSRSSFFCVDHKQSAPDAKYGPPPKHDDYERDREWHEEQQRRWRLRKELFPTLADNAVILGNFNQLYKIDPTTFRSYLKILRNVPYAILWLLRFPDVGEQNLLQYARTWAGSDVSSRIVFTDVAPKGAHITRASVVDLFLDTPECNAHTTAADVIWSGTPILTWARWDYKMCSRMASSIVASALPEGTEGDEARRDLLVSSEKQYEEHATRLASTLHYFVHGHGGASAQGRLFELRRMLWEGRWTSRLFDTKRWVDDLEMAYWKAWNAWESGNGGDIWL